MQNGPHTASQDEVSERNLAISAASSRCRAIKSEKCPPGSSATLAAGIAAGAQERALGTIRSPLAWITGARLPLVAWSFVLPLVVDLYPVHLQLTACLDSFASATAGATARHADKPRAGMQASFSGPFLDRAELARSPLSATVA